MRLKPEERMDWMLLTSQLNKEDKIMKTGLKSLIVIALLPLVLSAQNGLFFSFKSGNPISGSMAGLKLGPLAPFGGLDIVRLAGKFDSDYTSWNAEFLGYNWETDQYEYGDLYKDYEYSSQFEGSALLFMPHAGVRVYLNKFYLMGDLMMVLPSVDGRSKGERIWYDESGYPYDIDRWDDKLKEKEKEDIYDALNFMVLSTGIGAEYAFSEHFSVGGEYGIRMAMNTMEYSDKNTDKSEPITWKDEWEDKVSMTLGVTYTCFTVNFYW
jgi:hypothetical protein